MNELELTLARFLSGNAGYEDLDAALDRLLARPAGAGAAAAALDQALANGLKRSVHAALRGRIGEAAQTDVVPERETPADERFVDTVILPPGRGGRPLAGALLSERRTAGTPTPDAPTPETATKPPEAIPSPTTAAGPDTPRPERAPTRAGAPIEDATGPPPAIPSPGIVAGPGAPGKHAGPRVPHATVAAAAEPSLDGEEAPGDGEEAPARATSGRAAIVAFAVLLALMGYLGYREVTARIAAREDAAVLAVATGPGAGALAAGLRAAAAIEPRERRQALLSDGRLHEAIVRRIVEDGIAGMVEVREALAPIDAELAGEVLAVAPVRDAARSVHEAAARASFAPQEGRYAYREAQRALEDLVLLYPRDEAVRALAAELEAERETAREALGRDYAAHLDAGRFAPSDEGGSLMQTVDALRRLDPDHPLLADPRRAEAMLERAERALDAGDVDQALAVLSARRALAPGDPLLEDLSRRALAQAAGLVAVDESEALRTAIAARRDSLTSLEAYQAIAPDLARLARLAPEDPLVADLRWQLEALLAGHVDATLARRRADLAATALYELGPLLRLSRLAELRARVASVAASQGQDPFSSLASRAERRALRDRIQRLLRRPTLEPDWNAEMAEALGRHVVLVGARSRGVPAALRTLELLYADAAARALADGDDDRAALLVSTGKAYVPGSGALARVARELGGSGPGSSSGLGVSPEYAVTGTQ